MHLHGADGRTDGRTDGHTKERKDTPLVEMGQRRQTNQPIFTKHSFFSFRAPYEITFPTTGKTARKLKAVARRAVSTSKDSTNTIHVTELVPFYNDSRTSQSKRSSPNSGGGPITLQVFCYRYCYCCYEYFL